MNSAERELRDRFAIAALTGLCVVDQVVPAGMTLRETLAMASYRIADAMILERAKEDAGK